jgi:hypothetical protein
MHIIYKMVFKMLNDLFKSKSFSIYPFSIIKNWMEIVYISKENQSYIYENVFFNSPPFFFLNEYGFIIADPIVKKNVIRYMYHSCINSEF